MRARLTRARLGYDAFAVCCRQLSEALIMEDPAVIAIYNAHNQQLVQLCDQVWRKKQAWSRRMLDPLAIGIDPKYCPLASHRAAVRCAAMYCRRVRKRSEQRVSGVGAGTGSGSVPH